MNAYCINFLSPNLSPAYFLANDEAIFNNLLITS